MGFLRFIHSSIGVSDLDKAVEFYRDILGFKLLGILQFKGEEAARVMHVGKRTDFKVALLRRDGQRLELIQFTQPKMRPLPAQPEANDIGLSHITFECQDAEAMVRELKAKGVEVLEGTTGSLSQENRSKIFLFRGPDGIVCEVAQRMPGRTIMYDRPEA